MAKKSKLKLIDSPPPADGEDAPTELDVPPATLLKRDPKVDLALWRTAILDRSANKCSNCGSTDKLQVHMVVPLEAGGQLTASNGYVLCRACEMARDAAKKSPTATRRPINFWVSRKLADVLERLTQPGQRFRSMGELIRYLISLYVCNESRFDDLSNYQDRGSEVKVNAWVEYDSYEVFKAMLDKRGLTVTDALKGLVLMYADVDTQGTPPEQEGSHE